MGRLSRRLFLQETLLATASTAAGSCRELVAAEQAKQSTSPNERLSVAVLGMRNRGGDHARAYDARKDCIVSYVCDADSAIGAAAARAVQEQAQVRAGHATIFDDKSVDIVSIATPNHWHSLAAIWAMQAGKDVYVEKPVSHNISEGRRMVQVVQVQPYLPGRHPAPQ